MRNIVNINIKMTAHVTSDVRNDAEDAITALDGLKYYGRDLRVQYAMPRWCGCRLRGCGGPDRGRR